MNKTQYNTNITEAVRLQGLIKRHSDHLKTIEKDLQGAMLQDKLEVFQGKDGVVTYKGNTSKKTTYNLLKLFKKLKISVFLSLVVFNATKAKPLIASGKVDPKLIDSVTEYDTKTTPAKIKIQSL